MDGKRQRQLRARLLLAVDDGEAHQGDGRVQSGLDDLQLVDVIIFSILRAIDPAERFTFDLRLKLKAVIGEIEGRPQDGYFVLAAHTGLGAPVGDPARFDRAQGRPFDDLRGGAYRPGGAAAGDRKQDYRQRQHAAGGDPGLAGRRQLAPETAAAVEREAGQVEAGRRLRFERGHTLRLFRRERFRFPDRGGGSFGLPGSFALRLRLRFTALAIAEARIGAAGLAARIGLDHGGALHSEFALVLFLLDFLLDRLFRRILRITLAAAGAAPRVMTERSGNAVERGTCKPSSPATGDVKTWTGLPRPAGSP